MTYGSGKKVPPILGSFHLGQFATARVSHSYTHLTAKRLRGHDLGRSRILWHLLAIRKPMWCEPTCWGILPDLEILKYLYKFVWFESDFLFRHNVITLFLHVSYWEDEFLEQSHIHLTPSAYCSLWCSVCLRLAQGLVSVSMIIKFHPTKRIACHGGTKRIDLLASLFWLSFTPPSPVEMFIHFCNRKLKWFTTLKPWQFNFLMVPHPLECSSDFLKKKRHKWN